ncbi:MAG: hypothetical protein IPK26_25225 [Planctomycetes bacterium]|nr:hypothetical protein [Planctomycetota bacterium]
MNARPIVPLFWPAMLTLLVTAVRYVGERSHGPEWLFGSAAGGGGALVGIGWLIPVFGWWFGRQLSGLGLRPPERAWMFLLIGVVATAGGAALGALVFPGEWPGFVLALLAAAAGGVAAWLAWPALGAVLLRYALVARGPVLVLTLWATTQDYGTHYEKLHEQAPALGTAARIAVLCAAQIGLWIPVTLLGGAVFGVAAAVWRRAE